MNDYECIVIWTGSDGIPGKIATAYEAECKEDARQYFMDDLKELIASKVKDLMVVVRPM